VESTFGGEIAKYSGFAAETAFNSRRVYHAKINDAQALPKSALASGRLRPVHQSSAVSENPGVLLRVGGFFDFKPS